MTLSSRLISYVFAVVFILVFIAKILTLWTDYLWYDSIDQTAVFNKILLTRIVLGLIVGAIFFAFLYFNLRLARKPLPNDIALIGKRLLPDEERAQIEAYADKALLVISLAAGLLAGLAASSRWLQFLHLTNAVDFGSADPLFGLDAGYYVFKFGFIRYAQQAMFWAVVLTLAFSALVHLYQEAIRIVGNTIQTLQRSRAHLYALAALALVLKAWGYRLDQLNLVLANRGDVFSGASYADVYGRLPVLWALIVLCIIAAGVLLFNIRSRRLFWPAGALAVTVLFSLLGGTIYPAAIQRLVVLPNQLAKERPYIENNIAATNKAFDLDKIKDRAHQVGVNLTADDIERNRDTIDNIRLWDHRPLEKTLDSTQALRAYYDFPDVDVDRYTVDGRYRQVMLAPRQIDSSKIPPPSTWVKNKLQYTHGYGIAAIPVNEIAKSSSEEGLPTYWVKDIPPQSQPGLEIDRPGIYFYASIRPRLIEVIQSLKRMSHKEAPEEQQQGADQQPNNGPAGPPGGNPMMPGSQPQAKPNERGSSPLAGMERSNVQLEQWVIVNTNEPELDYPSLEDTTGETEANSNNVTTKYSGKGGISIGSFMRRLAFAVRYYDIQILLTQSLTKDSKILINRTFPEMVLSLCPYFLMADPDPYITIVDGKLKWITDAYTWSRYYPYSTVHRSIGANYFKNSVKVVTDAYDGIPELYVTNHDDPMLKCYDKIFPTLFKKEQAPENIRKHFRYPQLQFIVQAEMYADYHMKDASTFYQREDSWSIAQELYGTEPRMTEAYYTIMKLPGQTKEEFVLIIPMTLRGREDRNMVAWMAARCDGENYGQVLCYRMPKSAWVDGPMQVESRIGQNREFSEKQTLWSQRGSNIIRGNMLVIPVEKSFLYVEPIYIAAQESAIPELKLVAVVEGKRIGLGNDLNEALQKLYGPNVTAGTDIRTNVGDARGSDTEVPTLGVDVKPQLTPTVTPEPSVAVSPEVMNVIQKALELETQAQAALKNGDLGTYQKLQAEQAKVLEQARKITQ